jgi:predicted lipoprotein with Yx(FWY)xxD motif
MTSSRSITYLAGAAVPLAALAVAASGSGASVPAVQHHTTDRRAASVGVAKTPTLKARKTRLGKILVDSRGRTLYLFKKDRGTKSACFGACASAWPPLRVSGRPRAGSGVKASKVGTTKRSDGRRQVTYNRHPVYRFSGDSKPGDTNGQGLNAFGGRWFALSLAGNRVSSLPPSSGGGPGY